MKLLAAKTAVGDGSSEGILGPWPVRLHGERSAEDQRRIYLNAGLGERLCVAVHALIG